ncbi:AI-2E family transporter [Bacteroides graminisolvens]|uniref:AI-2E family transporter n=1 Tax=Bacteroides graminisolvens TaxID=477666 RepID=UPI0029C92571|nr:AI-2E family transporter [Bacteroides graminisolvens]
MLEKKITFDSFIRMVLSMAIIVGILMLVERLSGVLLPFFIAWLIAYLLYPLVKFFQYTLRLRNRLLSIFAAFASIGAVGTAAAFLLVPPVMEEFTRVNDLLVMYFTDELNTNTIPHNLSEFIRQNIDAEAVNKLFSQENLSDMAKNIMPKLWAMLSDSIDFLFSIFASFIILLYIVFILLDYESIAEGWIHLLPVKYRGFVATLVSDMQKGMNTYFRGQALVAFCVGILFSIGFLLIDFPLAIGLGLFIGVLNLVPYLQIIGFIPTIALAMLKAAETGENFWVIIAMALVVFAVVQLIQDGFLVPRIMGKITGLNPAIILLSLSIWGSLMGMLGMIIALPITTLLLSYYQRYIIGRGQENNSPTESSDNEQISDYTEK